MTRISLLLAALLVLPPAQAGRLPFNAEAPGFPEDLLSQPSGSAATPFILKGQPEIGLEQARGGEGRGGAGRRRERGGGRVQRANTGMDRAPRSFDRGNRMPSGGWSRDAARDRMANWNRDNRNRDDWNRRRDQIRDNKLNDWDRASDRIQNGWSDRRNTLNENRDKWNENRDKLTDNWNDRRDRFNDNLNNLGQRVDPGTGAGMAAGAHPPGAGGR